MARGKSPLTQYKTPKNIKCIRFIVRDDEQSPIKIIGVRADWKLFQGFIATIFAFLLTFAEFVGLEAIGIEGIGGD